MKIPLGAKVRDRVTGFEGIATSRTEYLNGCIRYAITPKVNKDGKVEDAQFVDEQQVEVVGEGVNVPAKEVATGGPQGKNPPAR